MTTKPDRKLLDGTLVELTSQTFIAETSRATQVIYIIVCIGFAASLVASHYFSLSLSKHAPAIIRPSTEITSLRSLANGRLESVLIRENQRVRKGDTLFILESGEIREHEKIVTQSASKIKSLIDDLKLLCSNANAPLATPLYRQARQNFEEKVADARTRADKAKLNYDRQLVLFRQHVIAAAEFENHEYEFKKSKKELDVLNATQISEWQSEMQNLEREAQEIKRELARVKKERSNTMIMAPVGGFIQHLTGLYPGGSVPANEELAQISPDADLIVEAYVGPSDIGMIRTGMPVRFQVATFNYNEWGFAAGSVDEVSSDIQVINDKPTFMVKCKLARNYLELKDGHKGFLKKGMTLQAQFQVTRRTLWQLLFDKVDNWLNPNAAEK